MTENKSFGLAQPSSGGTNDDKSTTDPICREHQDMSARQTVTRQDLLLVKPLCQVVPRWQ